MKLCPIYFNNTLTVSLCIISSNIILLGLSLVLTTIISGYFV